jgi:hypothetical protein
MSGHRKIIPTGAILAVALALSGCQSTVSTIVSDINAVSGALSSSQTTQAAANLKAGAQAIVCDVSGVASLAQTIEKQGLGGKVLAKDTTDVYTVSSAVCSTLGGASVGAATVPATATPVVAAPAAAK